MTQGVRKESYSSHRDANILIVEPALRDSSGHHAATAARLAYLFGPGRTVIATGAGGHLVPELAGLQVYPRFSLDRDRARWIRAYGRTLAAILAAIKPLAAPIRRRSLAWPPRNPRPTSAHGEAHAMSSLMGRQLRRCLDVMGADEGHTVLIPSADAELVLSLADALRMRPPSSPVFVRLMYDDVGAYSTDPSWRSALMRLKLTRGAIGHVHLMAETRAFCAAIREIWPEEVYHFPHPSALTVSAPPPRADRFEFLVPGAARSDKSDGAIIEIARSLALCLPRTAAPVVIRTQGSYEANFGPVRVEPLPAHVGAAQYAENWRQVHAALLLHDPAIYALRGSGAVCDAVVTGRPFICLEGSSLAEWAGANNGFICSEPAAIPRAILELIKNYDRFARASRDFAPRLTELVSAGLEPLLRSSRRAS